MSRTSTTFGLVLGVAGFAGFGFLGLMEGDRDEVTGGDRYSVDCRLFLATDSDTLPPALFGLPRSKGPTTFLGVATITNGQLGSTRLDGTKFALFGKAKGEWKSGDRFDALSIYLDDDATADQRRALAMILNREPAFQSDSGTALSTTKIVVRSPGDPLARTRIELGKDATRGAIDFTPMRGVDGRNPVGVRNAITSFDEKDAVGLGVARVRFSDHGRELNVANGSGEIHYIRLTGVVRGIIEEPPAKPEEPAKPETPATPETPSGAPGTTPR